LRVRLRPAGKDQQAERHGGEGEGDEEGGEVRQKVTGEKGARKDSGPFSENPVLFRKATVTSCRFRVDTLRFRPRR